MSENNQKKASSFFNNKQSTNDNSKSDITSQIKQALDMSVLSLLTNMSRDLNAIMKHVTGDKSKASSDKETQVEKDKKSSKEKEIKEMTKEELKEQKKQAKRLKKEQTKTSKKVDKAERKEQKKEERKENFNDMIGSLGKTIRGSFSDAFKNMTATAGKVLSGNSLYVDPRLRELQVGMGLDTNQAMALQGSMHKMGIEKEDLAFLTKGQRDLLSELTGTMEKAYKGTDMDAIAEMGNSMFKINALLGVLKDVVITKLQEAMTVLQPALDMVEVLLGQVIDVVIGIFESPEFKALITLVGDVVASLVEKLMPILEGALNGILNVIMQLITMLMPLVEQLAPVLMMFVDVLLALLVPLMPIIASAIDFIMQLIEIIMPIIMMLLPIVVVVLQFIGTLLEMLMPIIIPILQVVGKILQAILPVIYTIIASVYNAVIGIYNFLRSKKHEKPYMATTIDMDTSTGFTMPKMGDINIEGKDAVAKNYAGGNNNSSVINDSKNIKIDASFNSNITGEASNYSQELSKTNYNSSRLLASIIEEGS